MGFKSLAAAIILQAVEDYKTLQSRNGDPTKVSLEPIVLDEARWLAWKHASRLKLNRSIDFTLKKLEKAGLLAMAPRHKIITAIKEGRESKKQPPRPITIEDAQSAANFLHGQYFEQLSEFVGVSPGAIREKVGVH
jgi:hypothetical protein